MEWVETTGRTVEEAKDAALDQLGVDESDAEFVVLAEPRPGLFGRTRGEARVRARVRPTSPRPKRGRGRGRRPAQEQRRGGSRQSRGAGGDQGRAAVAVADPAKQAEEGTEAALAETTGNGSRPGSGAGRSRNRRSRRGRGGSGQRTSAQGGPARGTEVDDNEEGEAAMALSLEEQGESAREFVAGLMQEMGLSAEVSVRAVDESTAEVSVSGSGLGILIGPGGATLGALQELTRTVVQKRTGGHSDRILVDVAGYRAKRAEALRRFTTQVADEVLASGGERALEPMSASDRKVVHDTVNEIEGVQTRSEGEDPRRYIVISPAGGGSGAEAQEPGDDE